VVATEAIPKFILDCFVPWWGYCVIAKSAPPLKGMLARSPKTPFKVAYSVLLMGDFQPEHGQKVNACLEKSKHAGDVFRHPEL
jgi:hypothetical protein